MRTLEEIIKNAEEKVGIFIECCNLEYKRKNELGWGEYVVYTYNYGLGDFSEIVTFDNKDEAEMYLNYLESIYYVEDEFAAWKESIERLARVSCSSSSLNGTNLTEAYENDMNDFEENVVWDKSIRRFADRVCRITGGMAIATEFVDCMTEQMRKNLLSELLFVAVPGYYEE